MRFGPVRLLSILALACPLAALAQADHPLGVKRLIEYGWDVPAPSYIEAHIAEMRQRPFDGLILRLPNAGQVFEAKRWPREEVAGELEALGRIEWGRLTDNFIILYAASTMDWWSDADWECVLDNVGLCAEAARIGRCKGVCFDAEPYGANPWHYPSQRHAGEKTFAEYETIVRKRGAQFLERIQQEMDAPVVHTFFLLSYFGEIAREPDRTAREQALSREGYGLLPAFLNGMLDVAKPGTVLTDGNEGSYYYTEPLPYYRAFLGIKQTGLPLVAPENRARYLSQVECAQALYVDYLFDLWGHPTPAQGMTPEERARWFAHNTYWALATSDRYVWLYSERVNWWDGSALPPGLEEAVVGAREALARGAAPDFSMEGIVARARQRQEAAIRERLTGRTAHIERLGPGEMPPTVNGALTDDCWQGSALEPFLPYLDQPAPTAATTARVRYDDTALYIAVRCDEPDMAALSIAGAGRDDPVWQGDSVDLFLSTGPEPAPYAHLIVNPDGTCWDALCSAGDDVGWSPTYEVAAARWTDAWTLELALPWASLGIAPPAPGTTLRANLCRQRCPVGEHTSWSQNVGGFIEPQNTGQWVF